MCLIPRLPLYASSEAARSVRGPAACEQRQGRLPLLPPLSPL